MVVPVPLVLVLSWESVEGFRGVTPWKVWNMPPWVGTGIDGAMVSSLCGEISEDKIAPWCVALETELPCQRAAGGSEQDVVRRKDGGGRGE